MFSLSHPKDFLYILSLILKETACMYSSYTEMNTKANHNKIAMERGR